MRRSLANRTRRWRPRPTITSWLAAGRQVALSRPAWSRAARACCCSRPAASDRNPLVHIPAGYPRLISARHRWLYEAEPQAEAAGRRIAVPQGRMLGGSSSINGMVYIRGQPQDYERWSALGNAGWSWNEVLPWFKKAEGNAVYSEPFHGTSGPLAVSDVVPHHPLERDVRSRRSGIRPALQRRFQRREPARSRVLQANIRTGRRSSTAVAYLNRVRHNRDLTIRTACAGSSRSWCPRTRRAG